MLPDPITLTVSTAIHTPPVGSNVAFARTPGGFVCTAAPYSADQPCRCAVKNASKLGVLLNASIDTVWQKNVPAVNGIAQADAEARVKIITTAPLAHFSKPDLQQLANHSVQVLQTYWDSILSNQS